MEFSKKSKAEITAIYKKLDQLDFKIDTLSRNIFENHIIDNSDFIRLMNISSSTAKNWRRKGIIPYSQIENKIYYQVNDLRKLLNNNYHNHIK